MSNLHLMTSGTRQPTLPDDIWDDVFPLLRENVGVGKPIMVKEIAEGLGVKPPSVSAWLNGKNRPNSYNLMHMLRLIAERCPETKAQDVAQRIMRKLQGSTDQPPGTMEAAEAAARRLVELEGLTDDEAWLLVRGLRGSEHEMYYSARAVLMSRGPLVERHRSRADEMASAAAALPRVKAR